MIIKTILANQNKQSNSIMKIVSSFLVCYCMLIAASAQQSNNIYNPSANAADDITAAIKKAKEEHKFVLIQGGGNWCKWCVEFYNVCKADNKLDSMINGRFRLRAETFRKGVGVSNDFLP
jgi:thioredoxin-related protein